MKSLKAIVVSCQNDTVTMPNVKTTPLKCRLIKLCAAKYSAHENSKTVYICKYIYICIFVCISVSVSLLCLLINSLLLFNLLCKITLGDLGGWRLDYGRWDLETNSRHLALGFQSLDIRPRIGFKIPYALMDSFFFFFFSSSGICVSERPLLFT